MNPQDLAPFEQAHAQAQAKMGQIDEAHSRVSAMVQGLQGLEAMGDAVTTRDVVRMAAKLVATRVADPKQLAITLTSMPSTGAGIQEWIKQHLARALQVQAQTQQAHQIASQQQAGTAFQLMAGHMMAAQTPQGEATPGAPNAT